MSAWRSGPPVDEVLGGDEPPPSRGRWVTAGLVVAGLVAAFVAGAQSGGSVSELSLGHGGRPELAAGTLHAASAAGVGTAVGLVLPVYNAGAQPVDVRVADVSGLRLRRTPTVRVPALDWADVPLAGDVSCGGTARAPGTVMVRTGDGQEVVLPLAQQDGTYGDLHEASCADQQDLTPGRLTGVWVVDRAFGRWTALAGQHVLLFRRDGSLVADPEGVRFTQHRGVVGRYRLRGPFLDAVEQGFVGYACLPGERAVWRAGQLSDGRVVVRFVRGRNCPDQPGELWVLRRVAREVPVS